MIKTILNGGDILANSLVSEYNFWLQILGDHSRFIYYSLAPSETERINEAEQFIQTFDQLLDESKTTAPSDEFRRKVMSAVEKLRNFKLSLLALTLKSRVMIHLSSTFFNHMLNELEEFVLTLANTQNGQPPVFHSLHYNVLWLSDGMGHAAAVSSGLDEIEKNKINESMAYQNAFTNLYLKSVEMSGFTRTKLMNFPSLQMLNRQAHFEMTEFKDFLIEIRNARTNATLLGTFMPLMADHMAREECYYLSKLALSDGSLEMPDCNPARARVDV